MLESSLTIILHAIAKLVGYIRFMAIPRTIEPGRQRGSISRVSIRLKSHHSHHSHPKARWSLPNLTNLLSMILVRSSHPQRCLAMHFSIVASE